MGRCTRNATDYSLIFLMGQALADSSTSQSFIDEFPPELAKEIAWGLQQSELAANRPADFIAMANGLLTDAAYRYGADQMIAETQVAQAAPKASLYDNSATDEVIFSREMWDGAYEKALQTARGVADQLGGPDLAGYRAWWWYLTSVAANRVGDPAVAGEALERAVGTGINIAWLYRVMRKTRTNPPVAVEADPRAEELWNAIGHWGWTGPSFSNAMQEMRTRLSQTNHLDVHMGLEALGRCFGLRSLRPTLSGAPDVAWLDVNRGLAIEAKTEKKQDGTLYKKELQEAKGHPEWLRHFEKLDHTFPLHVSIVSPTMMLDPTAVPFANELYVTTLKPIQELADKAIASVTELRTMFLGRDFTEVRSHFEQEMHSKALTWLAIDSVMLGTKLA